MIAITSLQAYERIKDNLPAKRKAVLVALEGLEDACNETLADELGWAINRVTPRTGELRDLNLLVDTEVRQYHGYNVQFFKANKQERLF